MSAPEKIALTADMIVLATVRESDATRCYILLVKRGKEPFKDHWALPGGFVEPNENPAVAAVRECEEETGYKVTSPVMFDKFYSEEGRDPRGPTTSAVYYTHIWNDKDGELPGVQGRDDAADARWFNVLKPFPPLAFDHEKMIKRQTKGYEKDFHVSE